MSHLREVFGPKQEVALPAEKPLRDPQGPAAGGWVAEPNEADWELVIPIQILPETPGASILYYKTWPEAFLLCDLRYFSALL